jgi:hypothetical protein
MRWDARFVAALVALTLAACGGAPSSPSELQETSSPAEPSAEAITSPLPSAPCAAEAYRCADPSQRPVTDLDVRQTPTLEEPSRGVAFVDPVFNTCIVRVTDRNADISGAGGLKNEYSRVQSFNANGGLLLAMGTEGTWFLYDACALQPLGELPFDGTDPRWDATDPNLLYFSSGARLMSYRVDTGEQGVVHEFADDFPDLDPAAVWTRGEGRPSFDGRYWGLMAEDQDWETAAFLVYDQQTDTVISKRDVRNQPEVRDGIDHVTISPLGNYFLASFDHYCENGEQGDDSHPCGLMVYDRDLTNGRSLLRIIGHYDAALDAQGREVIVFQDIDEDSISMLDLASGDVTPLWQIDFSHTAMGMHLSGTAFERPGWAVISTHDGDPASYTWMDDQVFAMELKAGGRVVRLAHTHSLVDESQEHDYWAEPQASANPDLTKVVFTSNWGRSGTDEVEMLLIDLPPDWLDSPDSQ